MTRRIVTLTALVAAVGSMALAGCNQQRQEASNEAERATVQSEQKAREIGEEAKQATAKAGEKMADAVITTTVKAELAKDSSLSALDIHVDTTDGKVLLKGTAPSPQAREHATALASGVKGVTSVDNQLSIESKS